jgi:hypothetical protein
MCQPEDQCCYYIEWKRVEFEINLKRGSKEPCGVALCLSGCKTQLEPFVLSEIEERKILQLI